MPARKLALPATADPIADLGRELEQMTHRQLAAFFDSCTPDDLTVAELALGSVASIGWRATPATMAAHLDPDFNLWPYVTLLGNSLRDAANGQDPHQIIEMPSQYGKTTILMRFVAWLLDHDATLRIMYVTYDAVKGIKEGGACRDFCETHADSLSFRIRRDRRSARSWETTKGGGLYSTGIGGAITGFPQDVLLLDDLIKGWQAAHSEGQRELAWSIYRSQIRLRIQSPDQAIIQAGTRWHEDDPAARLMADAERDPAADQWKVIRLPAIAEAPSPDSPDPLLRQPDPLGRKPGEILEPARFPEREVLARRAVLGTYLWSAMEQQRPAPEEGGEILRAWWEWYSSPPRKFDDAVCSWDTKLKDKEGGDFVAGQAWGRTGSDFWFLEALRGQWNFVTTKTAVVLMGVRYPWIKRHLIENAGNGPEVIEQLRAPQPGYKVSEEVRSLLGITDDELPKVNAVFRRGMAGLVPITPKGDKTARMRAHTGLIEGGNVHLPDGDAGAHQLVDEAAAFPRSTHDDSTDACSQALKRLSRGRASTAPAPTRRPARPKPGKRATAAKRPNRLILGRGAPTTRRGSSSRRPPRET